jgi:putative aldouronate transport system permease protein
LNAIGSKKLTFFDIVNIALLSLLLFSIVYPLYYMAIVSISDGLFVQRGEIHWYPIQINFDAYSIILSDPSIVRSYANTLLYTVLGTFINIVMTSLCAYPLSRRGMYGRKQVTAFIIFTMFFSGGLIPMYLIVYNLGLVNTIWAIVIPHAINVWYVIIMRTFFQNIPDELHESAHMDGANDLTVFFRIVLPLSMPVLATMIMFYAVWHWNSFFPALIYLNEKRLYPVQIILRNMVIVGEMATQKEQLGNTDSDFLVTAANVKYAVIIITILPIVTIYPFLQKYFIKGVMVGSLKG